MEANSVETLPSNLPPQNYQEIGKPSSPDIGFLVAASFVVAATLAALIYTFMSKRLEQPSFSLNPSSKALCLHCQYFSHNPYLKCTIHPSTVLTEHAINCLDYCPSNQAKRLGEE